MKIMVVGAGIIGSIYGWALSEAGYDTTHFARRGKARQLADGIEIDILDSREGQDKQYAGHYAIKTNETLSLPDGFDLVIVLTKPYQVEEVLKRITPNTEIADYLFLT